jgi:hypothetical protein
MVRKLFLVYFVLFLGAILFLVFSCSVNSNNSSSSSTATSSSSITSSSSSLSSSSSVSNNLPDAATNAGIINSNTMIQNGDFSQGTDFWATWATNNGKISIDVENGYLHVAILQLGTNNPPNYTPNFCLQVKQVYPGFPLTNGFSYTLKFDAWATTNKWLDVSVWENGNDVFSNGFPWGSHGEGIYNLTTNRQTFTLNFTMVGNNPDAGLCFFCGSNLVDLYIANVSLNVSN